MAGVRNVGPGRGVLLWVCREGEDEIRGEVGG